METVAITSQAPVMPTAWPQSEHIRPVKRRLPNTVDEPKNIGYYLESLRDISSNPDRENILKEFFKEGKTLYRGVYVNLDTLKMTAIPV